MSVDTVYGRYIHAVAILDSYTKNDNVLYVLKWKELQDVFLSEKTRCRQQV